MPHETLIVDLSGPIASSDLASALDVEALAQGIAIASDDHREGVAAFFDKRSPKFSGG